MSSQFKREGKKRKRGEKGQAPPRRRLDSRSVTSFRKRKGREKGKGGTESFVKLSKNETKGEGTSCIEIYGAIFFHPLLCFHKEKKGEGKGE